MPTRAGPAISGSLNDLFCPAVINRALDDAGFQAAAVHAEGLAAPAGPRGRSRLLTESLAGQVPHDAVARPDRGAAMTGPDLASDADRVPAPAGPFRLRQG